MRRMRSLRISKAPESWNREGCVRSFSQDLRQASTSPKRSSRPTQCRSNVAGRMCGPRIQTGALQTEERIVRAENASANGFEALGNFAGGVVVAHVAGVDASTINILFLAYSASRVFYTFTMTATLFFKAAGTLST
ncbi:hypothetical protein HYQ44_002053 [Verticillium longisporum]|nr:hypothetical protein HYQ44_002053 [Verticillium longisporum]